MFRHAIAYALVLFGRWKLVALASPLSSDSEWRIWRWYLTVAYDDFALADHLLDHEVNIRWKISALQLTSKLKSPQMRQPGSSTRECIAPLRSWCSTWRAFRLHRHGWTTIGNRKSADHLSSSSTRILGRLHRIWLASISSGDSTMWCCRSLSPVDHARRQR